MDRGSDFPERDDLDREMLRRLAHQAVDWAADYLEGWGAERILQPAPPEEVVRALHESLPQDGMAPEAALDVFKTTIARYATHLQSPGNFAYVPTRRAFWGS